MSRNQYRLLLEPNRDFPKYPWRFYLSYQWLNEEENVWETLDALDCDDAQDGIQELSIGWPRVPLADLVEG